MGAAWLRLIPMLSPPADAPSGDLPLTAPETLGALRALLEHRHEQNYRIRVSTLDTVWRTVDGLRTGVHLNPLRNREMVGENRIVVHPDGSIASQAGTVTPRVLGNVFHQTMTEIMDGDAYQASLEADTAKLVQHCGHCDYQKFCDQRAALEEPVSSENKPCGLVAPLCDYAHSLAS